MNLKRGVIASIVALLVAGATPVLAQQAVANGARSADGLWQAATDQNVPAAQRRADIAGGYAVTQLNRAVLDALLGQAPQESDPNRVAVAPVILTLPLPDGRFSRFRIEESPILAPALAAAFPDIKTYLGAGLDDLTATARLDITPNGFHAQIIAAGGTVYVDPYVPGDLVNHVSYDKASLARPDAPFFDEALSIPGAQRLYNELPISNGTIRRTYRLALAVTGEYTAAAGGTKPLALSRMTTTMNRVNGIYEREVAVRLTVATGPPADPTALIYTNGATDPYTNGNADAMIVQNQTNIDTVVGSANYDIGHVFGTNSGGLASLGVVCTAGWKGRGITGSANPTGDAFDVDYVAHEMGHQFAGNHTFNSGASGSCTSGNRSSAHAYEVGSGSTIMAYAGICSPENLQNNSDDFFNFESLNEITAFITTGGGASCGTQAATGNTPPVVTSPGASFTVPAITPFALTAAGSDANGDALTYIWEEHDLGTASGGGNTAVDDGSRPLFRSWVPSGPTRTFPEIFSILYNANAPPPPRACTSGTCVSGEVLPSTTRTMTFEVTARDNRAGGGGIGTAQTQVTVNAALGPFAVTSPNTAVSWRANTMQLVTWSVNGSNALAANVAILLSTDGGFFEWTTLLASTPNDGAEYVLLPNTPSTSARIKVQAVGNIFFDISNTDFTLSPPLSALDGFNPRPDGTIYAMALQPDGKILVGGDFQTFGVGATTITRRRIARLNQDGSVDETFNPGANNTVYALAVQADGKILVGGAFSGLGGVTGTTPRARIGRLNPDGTVDATFDPGPGADSTVNAIAVQPNGQLVVGGSFTTLRGQPRTRIGRLNANGTLDTSFDPGADSYVNTLAVQPDGRILVGGDFTTLAGQPRNRIGRLTPDGTSDALFSPGSGANGIVGTIALQPDGKILLGGSFTSLNGLPRNYLGRLNRSGSVDSTFNPGASSSVGAVAVQADGKILVGGGFTQLGGQSRLRIGRLFANGALDPSFDPGVSGTSAFVYALAVQADAQILVVGEFTQLGGGSGLFGASNIGRVRADGSMDGDFQQLNTSANAEAVAVALQPDGKIVVGGAFTAWDGLGRLRIARLGSDGRLEVAFDPGANGKVLAVAVQPDGKILVGGEFTTLGGQPHAYIGRLNADGSLDSGFQSAANNAVRSIAVQPNGQILVGGLFTTLNGAAGHGYVGRLNGDGSLDTTFQANANNAVYTIAVQPNGGLILVGGTFTALNGVAGRSYLGRLNTNGSLDAAFQPVLNAYVNTLLLQPDGKVLIGGGFTTLGGLAHPYIGRVNADGSVDNFAPGADNVVLALALQSDGKILMGGNFGRVYTHLAGPAFYQARNRLARLFSDGQLDDTFDPGANNSVYALALQEDGEILVGGLFTTLGGGGTGVTPRSRIGRLTNTGASLQDLRMEYASLVTGGVNTNVWWTRRGAGPGVVRATLDYSFDGGATYNPLGSLLRDPATDQWFIQSGPWPVNQALHIRARGYYHTGYATGSGSIVESVRQVYIACPVIPTASLASGVQGVPYTTTLPVDNALGVVTYAVTTGTLPSGLTLSSAGVFSGTPGQAGTFGFTVTATDTSSGCPGSRALSLVIGPPTSPTLSNIAPPTGAQGAVVPVTLTGTNFVTGQTSVAISGTGVTVSGTTVTSGTTLTASFTIGAAATLGARNVTVTTPAGTSNAVTFTVNTATLSPTKDVAIDFGPSTAPNGLWILKELSWQRLHDLHPVAMVTGDLDGNGADDLVVNFGPGIGVFAWMNHATWTFLHPSSPTLMVTGDLDNNGRDDIVFVFPGFGVYRWSDGSWSQLHGFQPTRLAVGQLDGIAGDDLILDFPGYGLYVFWNNATWTQLHGLHANTIVPADLDGNGVDDVVIDFPGYGLWVYRNNATWTPLHGLSPAHVAAGNLDGNTQADLVIDFGSGVGLWTFRNNGTWLPLHPFSSDGFVLADRDGTGRDEIVIDFGPGLGVYQYANDSTWSHLHGSSPDSMVAGRFH